MKSQILHFGNVSWISSFFNKKWSFATVCKGGIESYYYSFLLLEEGSREVSIVEIQWVEKPKNVSSSVSFLPFRFNHILATGKGLMSTSGTGQQAYTSNNKKAGYGPSMTTFTEADRRKILESLTADEMATFQEAFTVFDKNQDGTITTKVSLFKKWTYYFGHFPIFIIYHKYFVWEEERESLNNSKMSARP